MTTKVDRRSGVSAAGAFVSRTGGTYLSAIMPNYNHAAYLPIALHALLSQTRPADEIIIVDDASSDNSVAVIEEIARGNPTLRLLRHTRNGGAIAAIRTGLSASKGDYVYLAAADDVAAPTLFEESLCMLTQYPGAALCCSRTDLIDNSGARVGGRPVIWPSFKAAYLRPARVRRLLERSDNWIIGATTVYRRNLLEAQGGLDPALGSMADGFFARRVALEHGFCFVPRVLASWRIRNDSYSALAAQNTATVQALARTATRLIKRTDEGIFPPRYATLFDRRWRFNALRLSLALESDRMRLAQHVAGVMNAAPSTERFTCSVLAIPLIGRKILLAWLALTLHPMSWRTLALNGVHRAMHKLVSGRL